MKGIKYSEDMANLQLSPSLQQALLSFEPAWKLKWRYGVQRFSHTGWRALPYIFIVVTAVLALLVLKPWNDMRTAKVTLAEELRVEPDLLPTPQAQPPQPPEPAQPPPPTQNLASATSETPVVPPAASAKPGTSSATALASTRTPAPVQPAAVTKVVRAELPEESSAPTAAPMNARGFLMRGEFEVSDFENSWPVIREKVISLGGKAAGSVELGWLRRKDQAYFHFSLPESNYNEFELFMGTFGPVRFVKERHPRVMPEGQIRIILTVKDNLTNESPAEAP